MNKQIIATLGLLILPLPGVAQTEVPITLDEAVSAALAGNGGLAAAEARAEAATAGAHASQGFIYPMIQATAGTMRTDDPVGAFGTKLRQGVFGPTDFELSALNAPDAVTDWTAGLGVVWEVGDYRRWVERDASDARARAARAALGRTEEGTVLATRLLYVEAVRAGSRLTALEAAEASALATAQRVSRRLEEGMATRADLLQAEAMAAAIRARVEHARAGVAGAREALADHLGWSVERIPVPTDGADALTRGAGPVADATTDALGTEDVASRSDLVAGRAAVEAAEADARAVQARRLPAVQAFGALSTHAPEITGGREANWTVGLQVSVPLFTGFSLTRGAEAARASARALSIEQEEREREARTQVRAARRAVAAAQAALEAARAGATAADEAVRLLERRYEEGMATVPDLLQAEARAAELNTGVVDAEANLGAALASLDFVLGGRDALTARGR